MTQHSLQGRTEDEILWFQRRSFLQAAAAWTAMGGIGAVQAQGRSNIVELVGDALVNGMRLRPQQTIQTGDEIVTGPNSNLIFVLGNSSFQVRQNSRLSVERGATLNAVSLLRLLTGAVVSVWGKGTSRQIVTPTLTAGIRGTGVYTEIFAKENNRSYFCNCYGTVDLSADNSREIVKADYHTAFWSDPAARDGRSLIPAKAINHSDEELEFLARLVDQRTAWQIAGKKGSKEMKTYPAQG
ncbi:twin-arginine translocation signal domain-containing protein [Rhodoferax sp.]|uniref:twin-arginine translocation signal domain-containing protein n=1 Tax=Rhodoferax sp. TaxID=50421 RepID=UPI001EBACFDB|nr:twin-arginine translocation signal domain-containing protein [Rhodoferax sp.]MBT9507166.1 twin-arginine translocation signal domain-containing protein [Rhodoferax sp.]